MRPTVRDIAKKAEVSIASVSLVLNNKPSRITEATRQRILKAARDLGYDFDSKQSKEENSIPAQETGDRLIGVVRSRYHSDFLDHCMQGIEKYAYMHGYKVLDCMADNTTEIALDYLGVLARSGVLGIIMIPPGDMNENHNNEKLGEALRGAGVPFLLLDQAIDRVFCDFITADNKAGAYTAVEHLIHNGHQEIGMIAGKREVYTSRKRVEGYKEALAFYNISIKDEYIYYGPIQSQTGYEGMKTLYEKGIRAVFTCDLELVGGVYRYAKDHSLVIGEDLSIVSFNDSEAASFMNPPLTCVTQPGELMGKKACEILISRITRVNKEPINNNYFTPWLTERGSVKTIEQ